MPTKFLSNEAGRENRSLRGILFRKFFIIIILLSFPLISYSQEMSEDLWQALHDQLAVAIIKLLSHSDSLTVQIDSLRTINEDKGSALQKREEELLALVGKDSVSIADFRRKFEDTEKKINSRTGTPTDARTSYFDAITGDRAVCLPEFSERYFSMEKKLNDWEGKSQYAGVTVAPGGETYTVVKGDCLYSISRMKYGSQFFWSLIWDANKNGVANEYRFRDVRLKNISDPNQIYPGQELYLPPVTSEQQKEIEKLLRSTWRERK